MEAAVVAAITGTTAVEAEDVDAVVAEEDIIAINPTTTIVLVVVHHEEEGVGIDLEVLSPIPTLKPSWFVRCTPL